MEEITLEEQKDSKLKKIIIGVVALLLLSLFLSYILVSYPLYPILESLSESNLAKNETIQVNNLSIVFIDNTYKEVQNYYHKDLTVEMALCLKGTIESNKYTISEVYQPKIIEQTFDHVLFESCSSDSIVFLHSQPYRHCIASEQDMQTLNEVKQRNSASLMVIMCEPNRFSVYQ